MNFFEIIRKGTNKDLTALQDSAIYEIAAKKLEAKSYANEAKPLFLLSKYFSVAYHFIGYFIALIGVILYSFQLDSLIYQIILIVLSILLLSVIEIAKSNSSNSVFSAKARKEDPNKLFLVILVITTIFSFVTSVWSAKEAVYFASTDTKFSNIDSLQNSQIDSVNSLYAKQMIGLESLIEVNQNVIKTTKTNWKINIATDGLNKAQTKLTDVLEKKETALLSISKSVELQKGTTDTKGEFIAKLAAVIFFIFEVLNLVAYWFLYQYYSNVILEQNIPFEGITKTVTTAVKNAAESITSAVHTVPNFVPNFRYTANDTASVTTSVLIVPNSVPNGVPNTVQTVPNVPKQSNPIGFVTTHVPKKEAEIIATVPNPVPNQNGNKVCQFEGCKKLYVYKIHNQKFCSENCRIENYKAKNNKTFFKKGGKNA